MMVSELLLYYIRFSLTLRGEVPLGCKGARAVVTNNRDVIAPWVRERIGQGSCVGRVARHASRAGHMPGEGGV